MSTQPISDGGPAFPVECRWEGADVVQGVQTGNHTGWATGMSLRDYFAAKVLPAYFSDGHGHDQQDRAAKWAYEVADQMLKARQS